MIALICRVMPTALSPSHCRICLQEVRAVDGTSVVRFDSQDLQRAAYDAQLMVHLREVHDMDLATYRSSVLRSALSSWPEPIAPQLLRSRLVAFRSAFSDADLALGTSPCCARWK
jgi:hypothetical protein